MMNATKCDVTRRDFLGTAALTAAAAMTATATTGVAWAEPLPVWKRSTLQKALITERVTDKFCETLTTAGYTGMEVQDWNISVNEARAWRLIAEKHNLRVHSVMRGWAEFNHRDEAVAQRTIDETATALRTASALGADAVLLVPCRVGGMARRVGDVAMPEAWDIDITFDPKTLVVSSVADGDNAPFADYIAAQNFATERTLAAVERLIPIAAKEGVTIAIENVWNNLWSSPALMAALVNHFGNVWVKSYFDLGNHTKYRRCEDWLRALGPTIAKLHIKDFKVNEPRGTFGGGPGDWARIGEGTINWQSVRRVIDEIGYSGYVTVESGGYTPEEHSNVLDLFFSGSSSLDLKRPR